MDTQTITIPKNLIKNNDLVIISRIEYEEFLKLKEKGKEKITEKDILQWSQEAKKLKRAGKLPLFKNLIRKEYPNLAKKYYL